MDIREDGDTKLCLIDVRNEIVTRKYLMMKFYVCTSAD